MSTTRRTTEERLSRHGLRRGVRDAGGGEHRGEAALGPAASGNDPARFRALGSTDAHRAHVEPATSACRLGNDTGAAPVGDWLTTRRSTSALDATSDGHQTKRCPSACDRSTPVSRRSVQRRTVGTAPLRLVTCARTSVARRARGRAKKAASSNQTTTSDGLTLQVA